jgi:hypothetical protein
MEFETHINQQDNSLDRLLSQIKSQSIGQLDYDVSYHGHLHAEQSPNKKKTEELASDKRRIEQLKSRSNDIKTFEKQRKRVKREQKILNSRDFLN